MANSGATESKVEAIDAKDKRETVDSKQVLDTNQLLPFREVNPTYPERKDSWITKLAIFVIGGSALASVVELLWLGGADWAAETLRLSLVASLAFVMGTGGPSNGPT